MTSWRFHRLVCGALFLVFVVGGSRSATAQATGEFLCSGGTRDGLACESDDDCPGGVCVVAQGVCDGGDDDGLGCDCLGGRCSATPACSLNTAFGTCTGGILAGECCDVEFNCTGNRPCRGSARICEDTGFACLSDTHCPGSRCRSTGKFCSGICQGGTSSGALCVSDDECPGSECLSDFQNFACATDDHCCVAGTGCRQGICQGSTTATTPTRTPTRTRTPTPTRSTAAGSVTPTVTGGTVTPTPPIVVSVTPSPTRSGSPAITALLASSIGTSDATISLDNANVFPEAGTIVINTEQIAYTGKFGNVLLGVTRGVNGTTPAAHASGSVVTFLTPNVPTPPRPTATSRPRGKVIIAIGEGGGCAIDAQAEAGAVPLLCIVGAAAWVARRRVKPKAR